MDISCKGDDGKLCHLYLSRYVTPNISVIIEVCRIIKIWSKTRNFIPSNSRGLSQFSWMCICVFYALQHYSEFREVSQLNGIERFYGIIHLLYLIFNDFLNTNWMEYTISPLTGKYIKREEKGVNYNCYGLNQISIESPFHTSIDLAVMMEPIARLQIIDEMKRALLLLDLNTPESIRMIFAKPTSIYEPVNMMIQRCCIYLVHFIKNNNVNSSESSEKETEKEKEKKVIEEIRYFYVTDLNYQDENKIESRKNMNEIRGYILEPMNDNSNEFKLVQNIERVRSDRFLTTINFIQTSRTTFFIDPFLNNQVLYYSQTILASLSAKRKLFY